MRLLIHRQKLIVCFLESRIVDKLLPHYWEMRKIDSVNDSFGKNSLIEQAPSNGQEKLTFILFHIDDVQK